MAQRCKVCSLDDEIKWRIERDILLGIGVTSLVKKYPEAQLNESNIYSHKKHLSASQARDAYEKCLHMQVIKDSANVKEGEEGVAEGDDKEEVSDVPREVLPVARIEPRRLVRPVPQTTGNRILDDVAILDTIIGQVDQVLASVTVKDVMEAIKLKHALLDGNVSENELDKKNGVELKIGTILNIIAKVENGENVGFDTDKLDDILDKL